MPTKRKIKAKIAVSAPTTSQRAETHLSLHDQIITVILMISVFLLGLVFTDEMSRAMAQIMLTSYTRQTSIGSETNKDLPKFTAVVTGEFTGSATHTNLSLFTPVANVFEYQLFVVPANSPEYLVDINSYGCSHKIRPDTLYGNQVVATCVSTNAAPLIPSPGDKAVLRYWYVSGGPLYNGLSNASLCGNRVSDPGEQCDDGVWNGQGGHCNRTCDGTTPGGGQQFYCSDGLVTSPEVCDDGALNGQPGKCNYSCSAASAPVPPTAICPANFTLSAQGTTCISSWSSQGELGCLTQCTSVITQYPNSNYRCSVITKGGNYYCTGDVLTSTSTTALKPIPTNTKSQPTKSYPSLVPVQ